MYAKRKSTLGTRGNIEAPTRTTTILNLLPEFESDDGSRNKNVTQRNSKRKQPRNNRLPVQTSSSRGNSKERPVNRVLYKRTALKPANSVAAHKESPPAPQDRSCVSETHTKLDATLPYLVNRRNNDRVRSASFREMLEADQGQEHPRAEAETLSNGRSEMSRSSSITSQHHLMCPESLIKLMAKSKLLKNNEETSVLTGGLKMMQERTARAHAARILSTPSSTNVGRKSMTLGNESPTMLLYTPLKQLTPQNLLFTKHKNDFPCSLDRNDVPKRQCKSTAFETLSCDTVSSQSKQKIFVDKIRMDQASANVENENQENLAQEYKKPATLSNNMTANGLQKEITTNFFPNLQISSPFQNKKPSFFTTSIPQNLTCAFNSKLEESQSKPSTPRLNHILPLSFGHLNTPIISQNISSTEIRSSVKSQAPEPKPSNISYSCCNTENILNVPSETNSALQRSSYEEMNICSNNDGKYAKVTNDAEAAALKEGAEIVQEEVLLKKPQIMEILEKMRSLQEQYKVEMEFFMERMKGIQSQQFEMLQKLSTMYQVAEERDECKQSTSTTKKSKSSFSIDANAEMESEPEKMLGPIIPVSKKKKRRSSRIAAKMNSSNHSNASTPDSCTVVVTKYTDLRKSFTFLRTPKNYKTQGKTPTRTPRTIVSTSIRDQLQLLYDTDSPQ